ncbi:WAT1-related protein [Populus alba x Populus x berolinensis]|uniref:WAT1-related protein n=1 Tax=Populus alba x Populus x berolinensis TaxID=444605 RepID=A0AAD6W4H4_9ROSI|nr:WAT1-related protein [Populus alba x Populus x berolinensis]
MGDQTPCEKLCLGLKKVKHYLAMVSLQFGYAGMYIIAMVSLKHGMSHYILAVYRHVVATVVIAPFAFVLERSLSPTSQFTPESHFQFSHFQLSSAPIVIYIFPSLFGRKTRPKLTLSIFLRIMVLGFIEPVLDQNLYYLGMKYTSATFASATTNGLPAITFLMALCFRLETVNFKKLHGAAKAIGTVITVTGAMVMTLYKGPVIDFIRSHRAAHHGTSNESGNQHRLAGTLMLLGSCCAWAGFFILQSFTLKKYPAELSLTTLICVMGVVEGAAVSLVMERDMDAWKIGFDSRLLAVVYSGVVCSGIAYYVQGVVIRERGPVFVTSFSPLCMITTAALGSIVLAEQIHLGRYTTCNCLFFNIFLGVVFLRNLS